MAKPFSDEDKIVIRQQIISTANNLFRNKSFNDVRISEIAKAVGIAKGSFYNFFPSKEALLITILAEIEQEFHQKILQLMLKKENKKELLIDVMMLLMKEVRNNKLFQMLFNENAFNKALQGFSEQQRNSMFKADENLLLQLIEHDLRLNVSLPLAVDMLRSVFFLQSLSKEIQSDINNFNYHMIVAVINEIVE